MEINEKLEKIVGRKVWSVETVEYAGYDVPHAVQLYLDDGSIVEIRATITRFDQYSAVPSIAVSYISGRNK